MSTFLKDTPIRRKLMAMLLLTSGAVIALTWTCYFTYELVTFQRTTVSQLSTLGDVVASNSSGALAFNATEDAEQVLAALKADPHIVAAGLYGTNGRLFARYPVQLETGHLPAVVPPDGHAFVGDGLSSVHAVVRDGKRLGTLYLRSDLGAISARLRFFGWMAILIVAASCALAYGLSHWLQRQISQPILALETTAREFSHRHDYSVRATKHGNDELGRLTDAFNQMLAQIQTLNRDLEQRVVERTVELQAANQELESFSYSVSHDLRAPLRHIGGYATMLERHINASLDDKGRRYLNVVKDSATRMGQLIDDLLLFCQTGRGELRRAPIRLDELIVEIRNGLQTDMAGRTIAWQVTSLPVVSGDLGLLRQVFANLLGNAVKYTKQRPEARIEVGAEPGGPGEAVVFVRDNGAGFDMKYVDKLFGVFQRLHKAEEFEGTGVGLATVRRIVVRHGGRVWAEAAVGTGATFRVALPAADGAAPSGNGISKP